MLWPWHYPASRKSQAIALLCYMTSPANLSDSSARKDPDDSQGQAPGHVAGPGPSWIAEVSHELRLPLANIKLLVETLLDGRA